MLEPGVVLSKDPITVGAGRPVLGATYVKPAALAINELPIITEANNPAEIIKFDFIKKTFQITININEILR